MGKILEEKNAHRICTLKFFIILTYGDSNKIYFHYVGFGVNWVTDMVSAFLKFYFKIYYDDFQRWMSTSLFKRIKNCAVRDVSLFQVSLRLVQTVRNVSSCVSLHDTYVIRLCLSVRLCEFFSLISSLTFVEIWCYKWFLFIQRIHTTKKRQPYFIMTRYF